MVRGWVGLGGVVWGWGLGGEWLGMMGPGEGGERRGQGGGRGWGQGPVGGSGDAEAVEVVCLAHTTSTTSISYVF